MPRISEPGEKSRDAIGVVPTGFATRGPKTMPRVDYERIFVLDSRTNLLGEYALNDECPLESSDLMRSLPVSGLRHLVSFYQGEYAYTPFKVDDLWFVILTRGVPRIEERGSVGTLLAAARIHIPPMIEPLLAKRETDLRAREQEFAQRESELSRREQRASILDANLRLASTRLNEMEADVRAREAKLVTLRDYAVQIQRTFVPQKEDKPKEARPGPSSLAAPSS
ncbi:MAG TPA: hypothetical protein VEY12_00915 [Thermoplasmata archaeon]|nr:hypothetical protein [Thermoplasmata archaeon]